MTPGDVPSGVKPATGETTGGFVPGPFNSPASTTPTTANGVAAPASVFGTTSLGFGTGLGAGAGSGTAGLGGANTRTPSPSTATSFTLPGLYGQAPVTFSAGQGRLARQRYVWTGTAQIGYDDNILQTPTAQQGSPAVVTEVLVQPAIPERTVLVPNPPPPRSPIGARPPPTFTRVTIPAQEAVFEKVLVSPAIIPQERIGSVVARTGLGFEMQLSSRKTVFTADAHVSSDFYFNRPNDKQDLNGNVAFIYAHRVTSRMQFSANVSAAYLSQPDVRVVSGPTRNVGDYLTANAKFDLSYQWAKRFSTVTSLSFSSLTYNNAVQEANNTYTTTLGTEGRYLWNSHLTDVVELRYSKTTYPSTDARNSTTAYLLVGADFALSRRLSAIFRVGESVRSFDIGGDVSSSPYLEINASYRFSSTGTLSWSSRFGFEEPQDASSEVVVFRTSLSAVQAFTSRLRGSASIGYIHRNTDQSLNVLVPTITGDTYTLDLGLDYALTKKFSVNASYSFVDDLSSLEQTGYYRNQFFLGAQYTY